MITPIILAGGSGSRLWPLSRGSMPKQFLKISSENTMIQETVLRLSELDTDSPLCLCNEEHRFVVAEQMREIDSLGKIILEPIGRNTAPAIALAALSLIEQNTDTVMLVLAADHVIENKTEFQDVIKKSIPIAEKGKLVTFGIVPTHAETGFGYIQKGSKCLSDAFVVNQFVEKPDAQTANKYLSSGDYLWNSGMFMFKASRYIEELEKHHPKILNACKKAIARTSTDMDFIRVDKVEFIKCPADSIDYAVMEKTDSAVVVPLDASWNDIGSFSAIWDINDKDHQGNVHKGDVLSYNSSNNLVIAEHKLVTTVGLDNCIVIETKDAVLVANKDCVQDVKKIVEEIKSLGRSEADIHRQVYRPWGHYDLIGVGKRDQVKRITVKPGEKLSIQMHHHRAEHWIVVSGTAKVTNGDKVFLLRENESTYIPIGTIHALENPGVIPLELIEVQSGGYLGEDDIVRFEDRYGRA
ncbi:mannose-1-phosphate guanylyltransferase/mannose-6-phosphate isomerase [Colwellia piezophila]|uniref:mannose-1-phosphate guanylyltransferase/mannose-6-phosphate isomerase n=1 Tax=Colwellia piezophila TaxID=211668 RepID=UPI000475715D|nr:mannose-1-phosphate guanylyltransferase/mannose-6-phosphate isomerase [Colwellia piezophila]